MKTKVKTAVVNNSTNEKKTHKISAQVNEHKNGHDLWIW